MGSLFFSISKLAWLVISPDSIILILLVIAWALLWCGAYRWARRLLTLSVATLLAIAVFPFGEWLIYPLENRFPTNPELPEKVDGIIVLGGAENAFRSAIWDQVETNDGAERFFAFIRLSRIHPHAKLVFTGGSGSLTRQGYRGADVARRLFSEQQVDPLRLIFERDSRNTHENALFSKAKVVPAPGETWILVTTAMHMPRSVGIFCKAGWPVIPYPVDHRTSPGHLIRANFNLSGGLRNLSSAAREWTGLVAYYLTGKTTAFFPEQCN